MLCTFRQRCRQTPQRSNRRPSRSMWTIMYPSVSSTFVTVCAFNPSCFLRNVSTSTSILFLSMAITTALKRLDVWRIHAVHSTANLLHLKSFNFNCTFWRGAIFSYENRKNVLFLPLYSLGM